MERTTGNEGPGRGCSDYTHSVHCSGRQSRTEYQTVEYHSREWDAMVEQGWTTMYTQLADGKTYAFMIRESGKWGSA